MQGDQGNLVRWVSHQGGVGGEGTDPGVPRYQRGCRVTPQERVLQEKWSLCVGV
jgi:hypothetical protein